MHKKIFVFLLLFLSLYSFAYAGVTMDGIFPYRLEEGSGAIAAGSSNLLYLVVSNVNDKAQQAKVELVLPDGLEIVKPGEWTRNQRADQIVWQRDIHLPENYGQWFEFMEVTTNAIKPGTYFIHINVSTKEQSQSKQVAFSVQPPGEAHREKAQNKAYSAWQLSRVILPVDKEGLQDERVASNVLYISDATLENLRSSLTGRGVANWAALEKHPMAHALVVVDNPSHDTQLLQLRAELLDIATGMPVIGLQSMGEHEDVEQEGVTDNASKSLVALNGQDIESFVLPLYASADVKPGNYKLHLQVRGTDKQADVTVPVSIVVKRNQTAYVLFLGMLGTLLFVLMAMRGVKKWLSSLEAKGVITIALFASVAFGSISIPTTLFGDFLKLLLGPFAGLATGLLSGTLLYLLITALFLLYPQRGTIALMIFLKWVLGALLFGRITPIGVVVFCTQGVILEGVVSFWRKVTKGENGKLPGIYLALLFGLADAALTYVNMELMMFFYRLYYADWYIWLHVIVCGLVYTFLGTCMGYRLGHNLKQVMGE